MPEPVFIWPQDLHIHTTFSLGDSSVVPEQTVAFVAAHRHAARLGISDHAEWITGDAFEAYQAEVRAHGLYLGVEVDGAKDIPASLAHPFDYYLYHCRDEDRDYLGAERLLDSGKPVIVSHPLFLGTDASRLPAGCLVEVNNRYVWRSDWRSRFQPFVGRFRFVIGSDAHQPHWLTQHVARLVARELGIVETLLFQPNAIGTGFGHE